MTRILAAQTPEHIGETVTVAGWVHRVRDHSKVLFIDLRDRSGLLQVVAGGWTPEAYAALKECGSEDVIEITGSVATRPEKLINPNIVSGTVELQAASVTVLNKRTTPLPFLVDEDTSSIDEELRLEYRYLDMRSDRMRANVRARAAMFKLIRAFLDSKDFTEIETPLLSAATPEGARDFIVPTRAKGKFFALPQSPQQFKQLLMVGGMERYYQVAKCFRDEDSRKDRQPEFTQIDMEMSFVEQEDVISLNEELLIKLVTELYPEKRIQQVPFPRISYAEAMEKYGTDRPDMRENPEDPNLLAFCWVLDFPFFEKTDAGGWTFTHNPFSQAKPEHVEMLMKGESIGDILTTQYDVALNGFEIGGGSIRAHRPEELRQTFSIMGYSDEQVEAGFGHMLKALTLGAPPHGGIAWGFDRLVMLLQGEPNIREVIPFAKTGEGQDPLMAAPSAVTMSSLSEVGLALLPDKK
jgi:aspartyl-tRNA synthetase